MEIIRIKCRDRILETTVNKEKKTKLQQSHVFRESLQICSLCEVFVIILHISLSTTASLKEVTLRN